jgi:CheY-like chemotaxis protein
MSQRVLIVEDNPLNMELATDLLEMNGFQVIGAATASEGIERAANELPDVVLMDIALPDMDGLSAVKILKGDPRTREIPVIALTAHAMSGDEEKALDAGCDGYITKPIETRTFAITIGKYIRRET